MTDEWVAELTCYELEGLGLNGFVGISFGNGAHY